MAPRAGARNVAVGDVLVRLRDDPFDMLFLLDNWVDLIGSLLYSAAAGYFLVRIDPWAAFAGIAPLLAVGLGQPSRRQPGPPLPAPGPRRVERGERASSPQPSKRR